MSLIKGMLISYQDPVLSILPTIVEFQYNPAEITRVFTFTNGKAGANTPTGGALNTPNPALETYSVRLEIDATEGLEKDFAPITQVMGIAPQLAAIEMLAQPVGSSGLTGLLTSGEKVPSSKLPFALFVWGPFRITPVRVRSLTIRETEFDELLNPIQATVELGFDVLREDDVHDCDAFVRAAASYYSGLRQVNAAVQLAQIRELVEGA